MKKKKLSLKCTKILIFMLKMFTINIESTLKGGFGSVRKLKMFLFVVILVLLAGCSQTKDKPIDDKQPDVKQPDVEQPEKDIKYVQGEILTNDAMFSRIQVLNHGELKYSVKTKVLQVMNDTVEVKSIKDLYVGMDNAIFFLDQDDETKISMVVIDGNIVYNKVRVAIRNSIADISDAKTLYHDEITIKPNSDVVIKTYDNEIRHEVSSVESIQFSIEGGLIAAYKNNNRLFTTNKRVVIDQPDNKAMKVTSISRSYGNPLYEGDLEVSMAKGRLLLINDIELNNYLYKVVPSEMPASFHIEALKSQAIAARTYAISDLLKKSNEKEGYHVDDSTSSQVYNNQSPSATINDAINKTLGYVMMSDNQLIDAKYYSTSAGITASAHEVWFENDNQAAISYLTGTNLAKDPSGKLIELDTTNEANMLSFFKTIKMSTPDANSSFHRWKLTLTKEDIRQTLNANLSNRYQSSTTKILTNTSGTWVSKTIPSDVGEIFDFYVEQRGDSGVVMSIVVETSTGSYKIISEYNIRFTIRPISIDQTLQTAKNTDLNYSGNRNGFSILPSGFFAIEQVGENFVIYGGGYGHGAGMSQYGAHGLGLSGLTYETILNTFYKDIELVNLTEQQSSGKTGEELYELANGWLNR
jgi:stage II sporulation protein D